MSAIEKRIVIDDLTERVFRYEYQSGDSDWPGLLDVRDVHRLINGVSYMNQIYALIDRPLDGLNIRLDFEADQTALTTQLRDFDLVMTWNFQIDQTVRLTLDGNHTYWSSC